MKTICYSRIKLALMAAMSGLFVWAGIWMAANSDGNLEGKGFYMGVFLALFMTGALGVFIRYLADNTIAKIGHNSLEFHGLWGVRTLRYDHLTAIDIETTSVNFFKQRHLAFKSSQSTFGKTRIAELLLEKKAGKLEGILDLIAGEPEQSAPRAVPARRLGKAAAASPSLAPSPTAQRARGFGKKAV